MGDVTFHIPISPFITRSKIQDYALFLLYIFYLNIYIHSYVCILRHSSLNYEIKMKVTISLVLINITISNVINHVMSTKIIFKYSTQWFLIAFIMFINSLSNINFINIFTCKFPIYLKYCLII